MRCDVLLPLLFLLCHIGCVAGGKPGKGDSDVEHKDNSVPKKAEESGERRGKWKPRERTVGWGANKRGGALRIRDGDRKKQARDRAEWVKWRKDRGSRRSYRNTTEEEYHARIFEETEAMVAENQAAFASGEASYELEINKFADYTQEEIARLGIGEIGRREALEYLSNINETDVFTETNSTLSQEAELHTNNAPNNINRFKRSNSVIIDWRARGKVPPIKDQGDCGSCYAFSAVGVIESHINIKYIYSNVSLSEQQVVDCSGDNGCSGGWYFKSFDYIMQRTAGLVTEKEYPYKATENACPALPKGFPPSKILKYVMIPKRNETEILRVLKNVGPVSIVIDTEPDDFNSYKKGIYSNAKCHDIEHSLYLHAVMIVGAGTENGVDYWIIRNSWGTTWGEKGYMRIKRGVNMCGVADAATYPLFPTREFA